MSLLYWSQIIWHNNNSIIIIIIIMMPLRTLRRHVTQFSAIETPSVHVTVFIIPPPFFIVVVVVIGGAGWHGQGPTQSRIDLSIVEVVVMSQEFGQGVQISRVILARTAEHAPSD